MSLLNNLLSSIDPSAAAQLSTSTAKQSPAAASPKPAARPAVSANNGASQAAPLKRKADGQSDGGQTKVQRRDGPSPPARVNPAARSLPNPDVAKAKPPSSANDVPYRGTAGTGGIVPPKPTSAIVKKPATAVPNFAKKPTPAISPAYTVAKPSKSPVTPVSAATPRPIAKKGYAAMLQQAKQREQTKPPAPPVRHEPTKILTKKEREALRAAAKGKGPTPNGQKAATLPGKANDTKSVDSKIKSQEKAKSVSYQGTARPPKKPADSGYKGTAKPASMAPGPTGKSGGAPVNKGKQTQQSKRYDGYANWSDLDEMEDEEEDYESEEDLSDMEGGMWDVEDEEQLALKAARKEDAEALAEENEHKRQKEERKRKLAAMAKAAAGKRRY